MISAMIDRQQVRCPEVRLKERTQLTMAPSVARFLREAPVLLSAACHLITMNPSSVDCAASIDGWLCLTSSHLVFVPFVPPTSTETSSSSTSGSSSRLLRPLEKASSSSLQPPISSPSRSTTRSPVSSEKSSVANQLHLLHQSPLRIEDALEVVAGELPGELLMQTIGSLCVVVRGLLQAEAVMNRIWSQRQKLCGDSPPSQSAITYLRRELSQLLHQSRINLGHEVSQHPRTPVHCIPHTPHCYPLKCVLYIKHSVFIII